MSTDRIIARAVCKGVELAADAAVTTGDIVVATTAKVLGALIPKG